MRRLPMLLSQTVLPGEKKEEASSAVAEAASSGAGEEEERSRGLHHISATGGQQRRYDRPREQPPSSGQARVHRGHGARRMNNTL